MISMKQVHIQVGALDATVHQMMSSRFNIKGFPTIKYFAPGSSASDAEDYVGGRTSDDIVQYALNKVKVLFHGIILVTMLYACSWYCWRHILQIFLTLKFMERLVSGKHFVSFSVC